MSPARYPPRYWTISGGISDGTSGQPGLLVGAAIGHTGQQGAPDMVVRKHNKDCRDGCEHIRSGAGGISRWWQPGYPEVGYRTTFVVMGDHKGGF